MSIIKFSKRSILLCSFLLAACDSEDKPDLTTQLNPINGVKLEGLYADGVITDEEGNISIVGHEFFSCRSSDQTRYSGIFVTEYSDKSQTNPEYFTAFSVNIDGAYEYNRRVYDGNPSIHVSVGKARDYCAGGPS